MIGMESVKKSIFKQLIYYIQGMHKRDNTGEYLHMRIVGPPGTGKTTIAHIIANIYVELGILRGNEIPVRLVHRDDFIAKYTGQTGVKTKELLESCLGGVMLYDEGYSMGSNSDDDSFAKQAIDAITSFLSEHKADFCFIIVGYEEDIEKYFFSMNKGLPRRIPWYHKIEKYTPENIASIAVKKIKDINWNHQLFAHAFLTELIRDNEDLFINAGGDVENFITKAKILHANRVFTLDQCVKFTLTDEDFQNAIIAVREMNAKKEDKYLQMYT
jgi:DNA replicative helicase MCM subunit Mcm2 (Cdc46/Mcm family)